MRKVFNWPVAEEEILAVLKTAVLEVDRYARVRRIDPEHLEVIAGAVCRHRAGAAHADGGAVPNSYQFRAYTTVLNVFWWRGGGELHLYARVERARAQHVPYGRGGRLSIDPWPTLQVFANAAPERCRRFVELLDRRVRRLIEGRGFSQPPADVQVWRVLLDRPGGLLVKAAPKVQPHKVIHVPEAWLCTAGAVVRIRYGRDDPVRPSGLARLTGLPSKTCRRFVSGSISAEELAAELTVVALGGLPR